MKISVCIITYNEEKKIHDCLASVQWADEIIVVDSMSTDTTPAICQRFHVRFEQRPWQGINDQRNYTLGLASYEWVLSLDADEIVSPALRGEIQGLSETSHIDGYYIPRQAFYLGRWIHYGGWFPDYTLRLFRKTKAGYAGRDPHDKVVLPDARRAAYLKQVIMHYTYDSISDQLQTIDRFSRTWVEQRAGHGGAAFSLIPLLSKPFLKFIECYLLKRGFLDGIPGFIIAVMTSYYMFLKYAKLYEEAVVKQAAVHGETYHPSQKG